ncbi:MAG: RNA methyltransferase [Clostridia bacterium]|nr:RNA methyltransferase [Clostridia bacterium]
MKIYNEVLTSRQNQTVKWVVTLHDKKGRDASRSFMAEGEKLTLEAASAGLPVTHIFISETKKDKLLPKITAAFAADMYANLALITVSDDVFEKISTEKAPQGVISIIKYLDFFSELDIIYKEDFFLSHNERAIALSSVRDPGNLGSVIRSCVAFGIDHIVMTADTADLYNPKTVRSAMGSLFRVKATKVSDFASFIEAAKALGRRVFAAELTENAIPLNEASATSADIFVIGNEGHGISPEISEKCSASVYIPISKKTESLNASVAAAIFMWEQSK